MAQLYMIQSIAEGTAADATGRVVRTTTVKYTVGQDGPFTLVVPPEQNTPSQITALLMQAAKNVLAIRGL